MPCSPDNYAILEKVLHFVAEVTPKASKVLGSQVAGELAVLGMLCLPLISMLLVKGAPLRLSCILSTKGPVDISRPRLGCSQSRWYL